MAAASNLKIDVVLDNLSLNADTKVTQGAKPHVLGYDKSTGDINYDVT